METKQLRSEGLIWQDLQDGVVALDLPTSTYFGTNSAGSLLWRLLEQGTSCDEMASALVEAYGIEPARARADAESYLASLQRHRLVQRRG